MNLKTVLPFLILLSSICLSVIVSPFLPDQVVNHWDQFGVANGYGDKMGTLVIFPGILAACLVLFWIVPRIDPLKKNIEKFHHELGVFAVSFSLFFLYLQVLVFGWNLGVRFNFIQWLMPALSGLFFVVGYLFKTAKRNWFFGIKTPWTLASDSVWDKTHQLGAKLFRFTSLVMLVGVIIPDLAMGIMLTSVLLSSLVLVFYSYLEYRNIVMN